jgi:hypothetical protein
MKKPLEHDRFIINKSRYDSIDCYISEDNSFKPEYNDLPLIYDPSIYNELISNGKELFPIMSPDGLGYNFPSYFRCRFLIIQTFGSFIYSRSLGYL